LVQVFTDEARATGEIDDFCVDRVLFISLCHLSDEIGYVFRIGVAHPVVHTFVVRSDVVEVGLGLLALVFVTSLIHFHMFIRKM